MPRKRKPSDPRYTHYFTRKLPVRLHKELQRLSYATRIPIQEALNACVEVGVKYFCHEHGWTPFPPNAGLPLDWDAVEEDQGRSCLHARGEQEK